MDEQRNTSETTSSHVPKENRSVVAADNDATVISKGPVLEPISNAPFLRPRELGKALEGKHLDHFVLEEFIGGGGMGAVFRSHDTQLDRTVAVKVLAAGNDNDVETRQRFQNEAQSAARLDHKNIARVHYVGEDHGVNYIVFEYIEGTNIRDLVNMQGKLQPGQALSYTLQVAEALSHAWERHVVHRDIKPSNILVTSSHVAKLVDMGLARMNHLGNEGVELTSSGMTLGTFDYISPEQARDPRSADVRSDIYSLGCTLYYMLCGVPPYPEGTVLQKLISHQEDIPPDPRELCPALPIEVSQLVGKMLAKLPDSRQQSPTELISDIVTVAEHCSLELVRMPSVTPVLLKSRSSFLSQHVPWMLPVLLLAGIVWGISLLETTPENTPKPNAIPETKVDNDKELPPTSVLEEDYTLPDLPVPELNSPREFDPTLNEEKALEPETASDSSRADSTDAPVDAPVNEDPPINPAFEEVPE